MLYHSLKRIHLEARFHLGFAGAGFPSRFGAGVAGGAALFFSSSTEGVAESAKVCFSSFVALVNSCLELCSDIVLEVGGGSEIGNTFSATPFSASLYAAFDDISSCELAQTSAMQRGGKRCGVGEQAG